MNSAAAFARSLYERAAGSLCEHIDAEERRGHPFTKSNIQAIVDVFAWWLPLIAPAPDPKDPEWSRRVRREFAHHVVGLCRDVIERHSAKQHIGPNVYGAAQESIEEYVFARLFANSPTHRRSEEWLKDRAEIFDMIWHYAREALGYDADALRESMWRE